jgi:hypothetical protein
MLIDDPAILASSISLDGGVIFPYQIIHQLRNEGLIIHQLICRCSI